MLSDKEQQKKNSWWQQPLELFAQIAGWLVFPILIALVLGQWLDKKFNTAPTLYLACVGIAFVISIVGMIRQSMIAMKKIDKIGKEGLEKNKNEDK
ncbi:AtpZ/AtpI family protein [Patescibacteria group bacterium]|nr:AtpZ/AtpI family protein [Patescibacteria group bacterium]